MSRRRTNPPMPSTSFGLLLAEGGDEIAVCRALAGAASASICFWNAWGRGLPDQARLAINDPNFRFARSIGILLDVENDLNAAIQLAQETRQVFGAVDPCVHGVFSTGTPRVGVFLTPNGSDAGSIETLCRPAVRDAVLATCVDQLVVCAGAPHAGRVNARASEDKGWLRAYMGMLPISDLLFFQAFASGDIDADHHEFDSLRAFVLAL